MEEIEVRYFIRCTMKLLRKRIEEIEEYHSELRRELMSHEGHEEGFVRGRLDAFAEVLELLEDME